MRVTLTNINKALQAAGIDAELFKGNGYFYFMGNEVERCFCTSVYVFHLTSFTVEQWVSEAASMKAENESRK